MKPGRVGDLCDLCAAPEPCPDHPGEVELVPGLVVDCYRAPDGAWVISIEGAPPGDEDCERVRVYLNEARPVGWTTDSYEKGGK